MSASPQISTDVPSRVPVRGIRSRRLLGVVFGVLFVLGLVLALLDSAA